MSFKSREKKRRARTEAKRAFREAVFARDSDRCIRAADGTCAGELDAHHVVKEQTLRDRAFNLGLRGAEALAFRYDPEIGVTICRSHHERIHGPYERLRLEEIPEHAVLWARRHGLEWWLDKHLGARPKAA